MRRGIDHATIYSIGFSPSSKLLAVTSDKSTLHIFDVPYPLHASCSVASNHKTQNRLSSRSSTPDGTEETNNQKWGILGKIPLLPRVFSDIYSFASAHFELEDNAQNALGNGASLPIPGIAGGKARKGIIGWTNDYTVLVIGAGRDGRWEKFILGEGGDGRRRCVRNGWKRYLGS